MQQGNLFSSQVDDGEETGKRKNCYRLKTETYNQIPTLKKKNTKKTYQPNAKCGPCLDLDFKKIFFKI